MDKLGMSLEDMIKAAPPKAGKGKGGGRGSGGSGGKISGGGRGKAARAQAAPYEKPKTLSALVAEKTAAASGKGKGAGKGGLTTGTKLRIANLDFNVTADDLTELFSSIGDITLPDHAIPLASGGRGWTRKQVDEMGTLRLMRHPKHWKHAR